MKDTDFSEIHAAQRTAFDQALQMVALDNIQSFDQVNVNGPFKAPHLLLEATEIEIDRQKKGSAGMIWVKVQYQAHCILPRSVKNTDIECLNFAAVVMKVVHQNQWGLAHVGQPEEISAFPGRYSNEPAGFDSWIVSWWQSVSVGSSWTVNTTPAESVLISEAPKIGAAHKDNYEPLKDEFIGKPAP
jgi:hypothetical protein